MSSKSRVVRRTRGLRILSFSALERFSKFFLSLPVLLVLFVLLAPFIPHGDVSRDMIDDVAPRAQTTRCQLLTSPPLALSRSVLSFSFLFKQISFVLLL